MRERIICPFHKESTPSMVLFYETGRYKCFGCGVSGKLTDIGIDAKGSYESKKENIKESIQNITQYPIKDFRGLKFHCDDTGAYIIWPGSVYYKKRYFDPAPGYPKYKGPKGHNPPAFIAERDKKAETGIVVEGEINALSLAEVLRNITIVSPGSASSFADVGELLKDYRNVLVIADNDPAGVMGIIPLVSELKKNAINTKVTLWDRDANEVLVNDGKTKLLEKAMAEITG